ncbi:Bud-site selection protein [Patellaria atrata CBS 101060]|uniref:Bud-site selection protein n=1 Tax=Patellaria atrata CBS 101060 TaxID=1346257 RepID=A0A9P4S930_9PEZI|nr:Bud-site selection protein [Patellaria atrata CBS 101060]
MPKRKPNELYTSHSEEDAEPNQPVRPRMKFFEQKLERGKVTLFRALKLARGFERQKLGRRYKDATKQSDGATLTRLDAEILVLKKLDLTAAAEQHLYKTLLKIKSIASSDGLPAFVRESVQTAPTDAVTANVTARLYNANPVKEALARILVEVKLILGIKEPSVSKETVKSKKTAMNGFKSEVTQEPAPSQDTSPSSEPFANFDSESSSEEDNLSQARPLSPEYAVSASRKSAYAPAPTPPRGSTFLPSLTLGGYISNSESEASDDSEMDIGPRKNRRGQRARREIWEKKYGKKAKHLQAQPNPQSARGSRDKGWDPRRGAIEQGDRRRVKGPDRGHARPGGSGANVVPLKQRPKAKKRDDEGRLHPSWEAAKKAKEIKQTAQFQGKKIVFD